MPFMRPLFVFIIFFIITSPSKAQSVKGSWYAVGHIQMDGNTENYLTELIIKGEGNKSKGEFNYYFRDSLFKNKINYSYNNKTRLLIIHKFPVIYYRSQSTKKAVMCDVIGTFELRVAKTESVLNGSITSASEYNFLMPVINYRMLKDPELSTNNKNKNKVLKPDILIDSFSKLTAIIDNFETKNTKDFLKSDSSVPKYFSEKNIIPIEVITEKAFKNRKKDYEKILEVDNSTIKLEVYDNGIIDYDSVSLLLNGKLILPKTMLTHHSVKLTIELDKTLEFNELGMFAENLGLIPPNTAALIIRDGKKKYEVILNSDFNKNAIIQLKLNK